MVYHVYYEDNELPYDMGYRAYYLWSTVVDNYILEKVPADAIYKFFLKKGCTDEQAENWLRSAEHKSVRDNMEYILVTPEIIKKIAEKEVSLS